MTAAGECVEAVSTGGSRVGILLVSHGTRTLCLASSEELVS